jgi:hypothetical protein
MESTEEFVTTLRVLNLYPNGAPAITNHNYLKCRFSITACRVMGLGGSNIVLEGYCDKGVAQARD